MNEKLKGYLGQFMDKYPHELEAKFPRIVERIAEAWPSPPKATAYFTELLIDKRGGRQGFPVQIATEIFSLSMIYDVIQETQAEGGNIWGEEEKRGALAQLEQLNLQPTGSNMLKAVDSGDRTRVLLYIRAGLPVDIRDDREWTPLMLAAFNGDEEMAKLLILHGADPTAQDRGGYTPLHWAALNGYKQVVRLLLQKGVDRDVQSNFGWTPMLQAASKGHVEIIDMLLDARADPNLSSNDGWTPLHKAVANRHKNAITMLLEAGASVLARHEADGSTPLSIAIKLNDPEILRMLRRKAE
jgi:ankyrin repeat protein